MNPIYNKYIGFLKDKGVDVNKYKLKEGYYWLDRQIIKAYDIEGNIHKILRLYVDESLNITTKHYKIKDFKIESWQNTIHRNTDRLQELETESLKLIRDNLAQHNDYEPIILTSGGKDSNLVTHLVRSVKHNAQCLFNNTSLDCADTYLYIKQLDNCKILSPAEGFYQWRARYDVIPTRINRMCCDVFKEGETLNYLDGDEKYLLFMGMRNEESNTRSGYGDEWKNHKWGDREWKGILPIRKWSEEDVWLYTIKNNIHINNKYKKGYSRVGCAVACPFYTKSTWVLDQYWYPKGYKRWQDILADDFTRNLKWSRLNCTLEEYMTNWNGGLVRKEPTEEVLKEFAEYKGLDYEIAKKYFNSTCAECSKSIRDKNIVAMNMKFLGRNITDIYCKKHLRAKLNMSNDQWKKYIEDFNKSDCDLF